MIKCPSCSSEDVRRSRKKSLVGVVQRWRGLRRYRCRECRRTFYRHLPPGERELNMQRSLRARRRRRARQGAAPPDQQRIRRHATELLLFLCLVVIFYAALKYFARVH